MSLLYLPGQVETWPLGRLRPYAGNAKIHGADQVAKIAASMAEFGWTVPVLVDGDGEAIAEDAAWYCWHASRRQAMLEARWENGRCLRPSAMRQSRTMSLVEAVANVVVGYGIAVATQMIVFPWFGLPAHLDDALAIGAIYTAISIARSYLLRRLFEALRVRQRFMSR